jgi:hypothetical protein
MKHMGNYATNIFLDSHYATNMYELGFQHFANELINTN